MQLDVSRVEYEILSGAYAMWLKMNSHRIPENKLGIFMDLADKMGLGDNRNPLEKSGFIVVRE